MKKFNYFGKFVKQMLETRTIVFFWSIIIKRLIKSRGGWLQWSLKQLWICQNGLQRLEKKTGQGEEK